MVTIKSFVIFNSSDHPGRVVVVGMTIALGGLSTCAFGYLVAERIMRFVDGVGADSVVASTDCGLGGRVHPQIAWAKLQSLAEGARLASKAVGAAA